MRLDVHRNGVKLFFITFAVVGRQPILSRLVDEKSRPELLPLGERVKAALLAIHQVWAAAGISDFVIMPDHVHFLMVVDFLRMPKFNPLWATHRLMDAIEAGWDHRGQAPEPPNAVAELFAAVERGRAVAAELARSGVGNAFAAELASGQVASGLSASGQVASGQVVRRLVPEAGFGAASPVRPIFERNPWLDLAFDPRQLKAIRHYIRLNPARALWKLHHPDLFVCHRNLKTVRLARLAPRQFDGIGNLPLLGSPFLFHVRLTLKKTVEEHEAAIDEILDKARHGWVPVSGFISPGEKEALRRLKAEPCARFIRLLPYALPDRYDPSAEDSREIAAGRLAILSPMTRTAVISSLEMRNSAAASHQFRANCLLMNEIGAKLCEPLEE